MQIKVLLVVFMVAFFIGALSCIAWAFRIYQETNWPSTRAVVLNTRLENRYDDYKYIYIEYSFEVANAKHVKVESLGSFHPPKLDELVKIYQPGRDVEISYDPDHPDHSMLKSESNSVVLMIVSILSVVLLALGLLTLKVLKSKTN